QRRRAPHHNTPEGQTSSQRIIEAAGLYSEDMIAHEYSTHDSLNGRTTAERISDASYVASRFGENLFLHVEGRAGAASAFSNPHSGKRAWAEPQAHIKTFHTVIWSRVISALPP
ncbi:MAG: CAP domain-containing protein, partial [Desulfobacterales bacterium]|nr:CAP domain-containing protein [Desulfobacterales bacterium]